MVGPYFSHHSPTGSSSGLLPFYLSSHTPKRDLLVTPLFFRTSSPQDSTTVAFPLVCA